jgi:hypothetical protein
VLAEAFLDKFGADNMTDISAAYAAYMTRISGLGREKPS